MQNRIVVIALILSGLMACTQCQQMAQAQSGGGSQQSGGAGAASSSSPLSTPAITGPLRGAPPITVDAGPLGKLSLNGAVSGVGVLQSNHAAGDDFGHAALSNGQVWIQKADGRWQFYVQAGEYEILALGTAFMSTGKQMEELWGPVPVAYLKIAPAKNTSIQIGQLTGLMGGEYTFSFENMNIERGLLWNQGNAVNRGIQVNQNIGKIAATLSWNDGYYSNRYSWLSGSLTYTRGPHTLEYVGMGNLSHTKFQTIATPVQNNGSMHMLAYTYSKGSWIADSYVQYGRVPRDPAVGIENGASTMGGTLLVSRTFGHGYSIATRGEYIAATGSNSAGSVNLLYGAGSRAWSATVTPTYQKQRFFARADVSVVGTASYTRGSAFGKAGNDSSQARGVLEIGLLF